VRENTIEFRLQYLSHFTHFRDLVGWGERQGNSNHLVGVRWRSLQPTIHSNLQRCV